MLFEMMLLESKQRNIVLFDLLPIYFLRDEVHSFELYDITVTNALTLHYNEYWLEINDFTIVVIP